MAVTNAFEFTVPAPWTSEFTDGEKAVSVASPLTSAGARIARHLSRWFTLEGGIYTLKALTVEGGLWSIGSTQNNTKTILNSVPNENVVTTEVYLPKGRQRLDVILARTSVSSGAGFIAFSLFQDGNLVYASTASGWVFDSSPIADADVPVSGDYRLTLPLLAIRPNWATGVVERLDFKTEVLGSEADAEQRRSIRRFARRSFEVTFSRHDAKRANLNNFFTSVGNNQMLVPIWTEQYTIAASLGTTVGFPTGTLAMREYPVGGLVWVNNGDPAVSEVLTIQSVNLGTDEITFSTTPSLPWPAGTTIAPLRVARVLDPVQMDNLTDRVGVIPARFMLSDVEQWPTPSWGAAVPFFGFKVNRSVPVVGSYDRPTANLLDNDYGPVEVFDVHAKSRVSVRCSLTLRGRAKLYAFRQFIAMSRGKAKRFWCPSLTADLVPLSSISGIYADMRSAGYPEFMRREQDARKYVSVLLKSGVTVNRLINFVESVGGADRFHFTTAMPSIALSDIERIMFVLPARFDQDGFEIQHLTNDSAVTQTSVVIRSTDMVGMTPIEVT